MQTHTQSYGPSSVLITITFTGSEKIRELAAPRREILKLFHLQDTNTWLQDLDTYLTPAELLTYFVQKLGEDSSVTTASDQELTITYAPDVLVHEATAPQDLDTLFDPDASITVKAIVYLKCPVHFSQDDLNQALKMQSLEAALDTLMNVAHETQQIPSDLVDKEVDLVRDRFRGQLTAERLSVTQYCRQHKIKLTQIQQDLDHMALNTVARNCVLDGLFILSGHRLTSDECHTAYTLYMHEKGFGVDMQEHMLQHIHSNQQLLSMVNEFAERQYALSWLSNLLQESSTGD